MAKKDEGPKLVQGYTEKGTKVEVSEVVASRMRLTKSFPADTNKDGSVSASAYVVKPEVAEEADAPAEAEKE